MSKTITITIVVEDQDEAFAAEAARVAVEVIADELANLRTTYEGFEVRLVRGS